MATMRRAGVSRIGRLSGLGLFGLLIATPGFAQAPELQRIPASAAATVLGRRVLDHGGHEIGRLVDVLVDGSGRPLAAVFDVGGYMGVGTRRVAVDWSRLHLTIAGDDSRITVDLDGDIIAAAPEYKGGTGDASVVVGPVSK